MMTQDSVKSLHEAFPELDAEVIDEVVATTGGGTVGPNVVNVLLGMSDPSYKPEEQDVSRAKELERDAEYARRLAASEMPPPGFNRPRQYSAPPPQQRQPLQQLQPQQQQQQQQQQQSSQSSSKTSSKIRNMLRIGRRHSNTNNSSAAENAAAVPRPPANPHARPMGRDREALDSDFSDTSDSSASSSRNRNNRNTAPAAAQTIAASEEPSEKNIFDDSSSINQKNLLSSYVPLSPSRYKAPPAAAATTAAVMAWGDDDVAVDLEHPFDSNPLILPPTQQESNSNPFTAMSDTNPFHKRVNNSSFE